MTDPDRFLQELVYERPAFRPTLGTWIKHALLLAVTFCTATIAGTLFPFGRFQTFPEADPQSFAELLQFFVTIPIRYAGLIGDAISNLFLRPGELVYGLQFSISLLFILLCHEMGHYIACRIYRVDATLPFFLPTPPMIGPAGTFGAFIKILSPMPSRKAVFDIGVAGPIAGFIPLIPIALIGLARMDTTARQPLNDLQGVIVFSDPLLMRLMKVIAGIDLGWTGGNAFYYAAWVGLLVTALNLIPSGQLDGGHAIYAALGEKVHYWTGRIAFGVMATLSVLGLYFYGSPSGFLIAVILGVMMKIKHPRPFDQRPLDKKRKAIAVLTLIIFILCFVPFPIQIN